MHVHIPSSTESAALPATSAQTGWKRIVTMTVLGYEGAGALLGGALLVAGPDGYLLKMPVTLLRGAFPDFLVPGIILYGLGMLNSAAFVALARKHRRGWLLSTLALTAMLGWFWIEIAVLLRLHWLHALWGLPVLLGLYTNAALVPRAYRRRALLWSGILSSVLYAVINVIVPHYWKGYDRAAQVVSELSAVDAPTRGLWIVLSAPYTFLVLAFGWGVVQTAATNRRLRTAGWLLFAYGALGVLWPFAPMHQRAVLAVGGGNFSDTLHLALGGVTELLYLLALGFAAVALGKGFRLYSTATFLLLTFFGALTFRAAPLLARNEPTPQIGTWERANIGTFLLWMVVLALLLLRREKGVRQATGVSSVRDHTRSVWPRRGNRSPLSRRPLTP